jgi:hypothetical protein
VPNWELDEIEVVVWKVVEVVELDPLVEVGVCEDEDEKAEEAVRDEEIAGVEEDEDEDVVKVEEVVCKPELADVEDEDIVDEVLV